MNKERNFSNASHSVFYAANTINFISICLIFKVLFFLMLCFSLFNQLFILIFLFFSEKLADSLKLPQSTPGVQAQVFLCFRVLLLRMSPHHVTSLWPVIITEMVQVMLQMEYELSADVEESVLVF